MPNAALQNGPAKELAKELATQLAKELATEGSAKVFCLQGLYHNTGRQGETLPKTVDVFSGKRERS